MKSISLSQLELARRQLEELNLADTLMREAIRYLKRICLGGNGKAQDDVVSSARASALSVVLREAAANLDPADFEVLLKTHFSKPKTEAAESRPKKKRR